MWPRFVEPDSLRQSINYHSYPSPGSSEVYPFVTPTHCVLIGYLGSWWVIGLVALGGWCLGSLAAVTGWAVHRHREKAGDKGA